MSKVKDAPKKEKLVPTELVNERQETMFDNDLTVAADDFCKAVMENGLWREKKIKSEKALIEAMKRLKIKTLTMGNVKKIEYKYVDAKECIQLKDFKPKSRRFSKKRAF